MLFTSKYEKIDLINHDNEIIKTIKRKDLVAGQDMTRFIHVFVFDGMGNMILQQRHNSKNVGANLIDCVGGFVSSGESFVETAVKELEEEFGLNLPLTKMFDVWDYWGFCQVFKGVYRGDISDIRLEENEVARVFKIPEYDIYKAMRKTPFMFNDGFQTSFMHYWKSKFGFNKLSVVNESGEPIGGCTWEEMEDETLICEAVHVVLENDKGEILIQKRGSTMGSHPNTLDVSASGHIDEGERAEASAYRETAEEIGVTDVDLEYIDKFYIEHDAGGYLKKEWIHVYTGKYDGEIKVEEEEEELAAVAWFKPEEIKMIIEKMPALTSPVSIKSLKCYFDNKAN